MTALPQQSRTAPGLVTTPVSYGFDRAARGLQCSALQMVSTTVFSEVRNRTELSSETINSINKVQKFASLLYNWDSYDAEMISAKAISSSIDFLRNIDKYNCFPYFISPCRDGGVMIEYKNKTGNSAEIYFFYDGRSELILFASNNDSVYVDNSIDIGTIISHLNE
jgi:hypothetical protein